MCVCVDSTDSLEFLSPTYPSLSTFTLDRLSI